MREIRNNAYVFSNACKNYGEILICRACDGIPDNKNIFNYLKIAPSEVDYLSKSHRNCPDCPVILLGCRSGTERMVLIFGLSVFESSASVAIEMTGNPENILYTRFMLGDCDIAISDAARRAAAPRGNRKSWTEYVNDEISLNDWIGFSRLVSECSGSAAEFIAITESAAYLTGVGLKFASSSFSHLQKPFGYACASGYFAAAVLVLSLTARRHSKNRLFNVFAIEESTVGKVCLSFELFDEPACVIRSHLTNAADRLGLPISFSSENGRFYCCFSPYRKDDGNFGLKEGKEPFVYDAYRNYGINESE